MQLKFQYNKTSLKNIEKQVKIRQNALPILKSKESALRVQVQSKRKYIQELENDMDEYETRLMDYVELWNEFRFDLVQLENVEISYSKIAGVKIAEVAEVIFIESDYLMPAFPLWYDDGIKILKEYISFKIRIEIEKNNLKELEFARRKTTQKVNLYEKVHIPEYQSAIKNIKRFLENEEHISISAQKILKSRLWTTKS